MRIAEDPLLEKLPTDLRFVVESRDHAQRMVSDLTLVRLDALTDVLAAEREAAAQRLSRHQADERAAAAREGIWMRYAAVAGRLRH